MINQQFEVVIIGGSAVDITGIPSQQLKEMDSNPGKIIHSFGGVGRNMAENLLRLGVKTLFITIVGQDLLGQQLMDNFKTFSDTTFGIFQEKETATACYLSILDNNHDMIYAISDMDINKSLTIEKLKQFNNQLDQAKFIILEGNLNQDLIEFICEKYKGKVCFDSVSTKKCEKILNSLQNLYLIKPNLIEASVIMKKKIESHEEIKECLIYFKELGIKIPVISLSSKGVAFLNSENKMIIINVNKKVNIKNCTGAGDSFFSGMIVSLLKSTSIEDAIITGQVISQITLQSECAVNPELCFDLYQKNFKEAQNYIIRNVVQ